jgi:hypothetical protein
VRRWNRRTISLKYLFEDSLAENDKAREEGKIRNPNRHIMKDLSN